eukprot:m.314165 g.314165  ORF g.314165 m.314165 type:complete len:204 (+) comp15970_c0_seq4:1061-1672(+)
MAADGTASSDRDCKLCELGTYTLTDNEPRNDLDNNTPHPSNTAAYINSVRVRYVCVTMCVTMCMEGHTHWCIHENTRFSFADGSIPPFLSIIVHLPFLSVQVAPVGLRVNPARTFYKKEAGNATDNVKSVKRANTLQRTMQQLVHHEVFVNEEVMCPLTEQPLQIASAPTVLMASSPILSMLTHASPFSIVQLEHQFHAMAHR